MVLCGTIVAICLLIILIQVWLVMILMAIYKIIDHFIPRPRVSVEPVNTPIMEIPEEHIDLVDALQESFAIHEPLGFTNFVYQPNRPNTPDSDDESYIPISQVSFSPATGTSDRATTSTEENQ